MEFQCLQKWLILKQECEWLQMASLIVLGQLLGAKDLWRGVECETQGSVKSCKKCGIGSALDGTEDNVLFEESVSCWVHVCEFELQMWVHIFFPEICHLKPLCVLWFGASYGPGNFRFSDWWLWKCVLGCESGRYEPTFWINLLWKCSKNICVY